jgi:hypothetical protein
MGAETSTLQSIESLNKTLTDIETKLGVVEDIHLHHERSICHDDMVIISGKPIRCNPTVRLAVGPVVGLLGQDFARIMVESNCDADLSYHVFIIDDRASFSRYLFEMVRLCCSCTRSLIVNCSAVSLSVAIPCYCGISMRQDHSEA